MQHNTDYKAGVFPLYDNQSSELPAEVSNGEFSMGRLHCLTIIGQIEGHMELGGQTKTTKYEHILPLLTAIEESAEIDGLLILLNTVGGDVEAGLAIAELISGMSKLTSGMKVTQVEATGNEDLDPAFQQRIKE